MSSTKPVIFISYSHRDEPEKPHGDEVAWLSFVRTYLQPAVKGEIIELWDDRHLEGGANWDPEIERKLRECDIFILLVSAHSVASDYIVDREIATIRERQAGGEDVHFYPLLLTPTPEVGLDKVKDKNLRPRDAKPFSGFSRHDRMQHMTDAANEIAKIAARIGVRKSAAAPVVTRQQPAYVHITGLPETPYEHLVGRDAELKRLDDAWEDNKTNILSLVAEGGAGKSALANEWLKRMQTGNYRGAETVLGWSFYSQGTKERATSADAFLNWALEKLGFALKTTSATAKGDAIAEALMNRRVLLLLDGVEPLQHGPDGQPGQLKDQGLRALLRRFAAASPAEARGLIVLTSRLAVVDIIGRKDGAAPVIDVEKLSDESGAVLLRDNGVWGTDKELKNASRDFGGHPLALGLLASFLKETQSGDVRRRDHIRELLTDAKNPGHDHAARVMESYEREWLSKDPVLRTIMFLMGLFDRPAEEGCLKALRREPVISGLAEDIVKMDDVAWRHAVARLREVRLLVPAETSKSEAVDAHPLVREWFGARLKKVNERAWKAAHSRLYEHLRDTTNEGSAPTLEQLASLYQAIGHGCQAERYDEALKDLYIARLTRRSAFYTKVTLGAFSSDLAVASLFFVRPFEQPVASLSEDNKIWIIADASACLRAQGRYGEAVPAQRLVLEVVERDEDWDNAANMASNLSQTQLVLGNIAESELFAERAFKYAMRAGNEFQLPARTNRAAALFAAGNYTEAERIWFDLRKSICDPAFVISETVRYRYFELLIKKREWAVTRDLAQQIADRQTERTPLIFRGLIALALGRAQLGMALDGGRGGGTGGDDSRNSIRTSIDLLRGAGLQEYMLRGILAWIASSRCIGYWRVENDINEVHEIATLGSLKLILCDVALERARLAFAQVEAFAPLNGMIENSPPKPEIPSGEKRQDLHAEAAAQLSIAAKLIIECGYHRCDEELVELQAVLRGERTFASLPIYV